MVPSFWAVHIPIHLLLYQLMTLSHGFNLGKASAVCLPGNPSPEFKVHRRGMGVVGGGGVFNPNRARKDPQLLKRNPAWERRWQPHFYRTLTLPGLAGSTQPTGHFVRFMLSCESYSNNMHDGHKQEESLSQPPVQHYGSVSLISLFFGGLFFACCDFDSHRKKTSTFMLRHD